MVSARLLDANLLIALAWPAHAHHEAVTSWFRETQGDGWATCPFTEAAFVRILSNPRMQPYSVTPEAAILLLSTLTGQTGYQFWPDDSPLRIIFDRTAKITGHNQITDAYLLALARLRSGTLSTLDSGITALLLPNSEARECLELVVV